jgi:hypothetical protein
MQITNTFFEKNNKHHFYSLVLKKLTSLSLTCCVGVIYVYFFLSLRKSTGLREDIQLIL